MYFTIISIKTIINNSRSKAWGLLRPLTHWKGLGCFFLFSFELRSSVCGVVKRVEVRAGLPTVSFSLTVDS